MMAVQPKRYLDAHEQLLVDVNSDHYREVSRQSWHRFCQYGLPTRKTESWRYTAQVMQSHWAEQQFMPARIADRVCRQRPHNDYDIVIDDQQCAYHVPQNLFIGPLTQAITHYGLSWWADVLLSQSETHLSALNGAMMRHCLCVHVPEGCSLEEPLTCCLQRNMDKTHCQRVLVIVDSQADITLHQHFTGHDAEYANNIVTNILLKPGAKLKHLVSQTESYRAIHTHAIHVHQARDSVYEHFNTSLGARIARTELCATLAESGASLNLSGLYLGQAKQHHDIHAIVHHNACHTESQQFYRGLLDDQAVGVFNSQVIVAKDQAKTRSSQKNDTMLLSPQARINTKPELQIYTDDVQCSHGATVSELDNTQLFYLQSRGIDVATAKTLLLDAFIQAVTSCQPWPSFSPLIIQLIRKNTPYLDALLCPQQ